MYVDIDMQFMQWLVQLFFESSIATSFCMSLIIILIVDKINNISNLNETWSQREFQRDELVNQYEALLLITHFKQQRDNFFVKRMIATMFLSQKHESCYVESSIHLEWSVQTTYQIIHLCRRVFAFFMNFTKHFNDVTACLHFTKFFIYSTIKDQQQSSSFNDYLSDIVKAALTDCLYSLWQCNWLV